MNVEPTRTDADRLRATAARATADASAGPTPAPADREPSDPARELAEPSAAQPALVSVRRDAEPSARQPAGLAARQNAEVRQDTGLSARYDAEPSAAQPALVSVRRDAELSARQPAGLAARQDAGPGGQPPLPPPQLLCHHGRNGWSASGLDRRVDRDGPRRADAAPWLGAGGGREHRLGGVAADVGDRGAAGAVADLSGTSRGCGRCMR